MKIPLMIILMMSAVAVSWAQVVPVRTTVTTDADGAIIAPLTLPEWDFFGANAASLQAAVATEWGATTVGENLLTLTPPGAIRFLRINANDTVSALSASDMRTALGLGTAATQDPLNMYVAGLWDSVAGDEGLWVEDGDIIAPNHIIPQVLATDWATYSNGDLVTWHKGGPVVGGALSRVPASTFAQSSRTITAGTGLTGGGDLSANRTLALDSATSASLGLANTAVQPGALPQHIAASMGQALVTNNGAVVFNQPHQPGMESWSMAMSLAVDVAPSGTQYTALFGTGRTITTGDGGTWILRYHSGGLSLMLWSDASTNTEYTVTPALTLGRWYDLGLTYDAPTTTLRFYVDGVETFSQVITPVDLNGTWPLKLLAGGSTGQDVNNGRNRVRYAHLYNFRLSANDVAAIHADPRQAVRPQWRWGRDGLYAWDWSAGVDGWAVSNASVTGNIDDMDGEDDTLRIEIDDSASAAHYARMGSDDITLSMRWVRVRGKVFIPSTNVSTQAAQVSWGTNGNVNRMIVHIATQDEWVSFDETVFVDATLSPFRLAVFGSFGSPGAVTYTGTVGDYIYLKGFRVDQLGASLACVPDSLQPSPGQWLDISSSNNHGLQSLSQNRTGTAVPKDRFTFTWARSSSGFLGDADRRVLPPNFVIDQVIWNDSKGTKTTASLGHSAGSPASHVASFTPTSSTERATVVASSANVTDQRLYLNMTANAGEVTVTVTGFIKPY